MSTTCSRGLGTRLITARRSLSVLARPHSLMYAREGSVAAGGSLKLRSPMERSRSL